MRTDGRNWRRRCTSPADALRVIAELLRPFMPQTAERMLAMLGQGAAPASWASLHAGTLTPGTQLGPTVALFPRIELPVEALRQMSNETSETPEQPAAPAPVAAPAAAAPATTPAAAPPAAPSAAPVGELISYRRLHEDRPSRGEGARSRARAEVEEAAEAARSTPALTSGRSSRASPKRTSPKRWSGARLPSCST